MPDDDLLAIRRGQNLLFGFGKTGGFIGVSRCTKLRMTLSIKPFLERLLPLALYFFRP